MKWRMEDTESSKSSTFDVSLLNDKLDYVFKDLKCAAKVNLAFGFVLRNIEDGSCRYFYPHENNTVMERSKLVCTQADMTNQTDKMQKRKRMLLILVPEKEPIQSGSFTDLQI